MEPEERIIKLINKGTVTAMSDASDTYICSFPVGGQTKTFLLHSQEFKRAFKSFWYRKFSEQLREYQLTHIIEFLEIAGYDKKLDYTLTNRIYNDNKGQILYDLNCDTEELVCIENGECYLAKSDEPYFLRSSNFKNQVTPNFNFTKKPKKLLNFIDKHFCLGSDKKIKLLSIYIVACLTGMSFNKPLLVLKGEKGSSKSSTLRKLELIIDPKRSGLCSFPKSRDGLALRLANSFFTCFDNLSYLSQNDSDLLAISITGGSTSDRALYENTAERICNIHSIVAINCIGMVVRSADLLDRTLLIQLARIPSDKIQTEESMWNSFNSDLPKILGCAFGALAQAMVIESKPETIKRVRMADFHEFSIKVGSVLGLPEAEVNQLLFENQRELSIDAVYCNPAALCLIEFMKDKEQYEDEPSRCLAELKHIAKKLGIDSYLLPRDAARLTSTLEKVKSELYKVYGISFQSTRKKKRKYIIKNCNYQES